MTDARAGEQLAVVAAPEGLGAVASSSGVGDYWTLLKPRVMSLVVFTGFAGLYLAPGALHPVLAVTAILCIAAAAGAAAAINNWYDSDIDPLMVRTCGRPTATGRIPPAEALAFGVTAATLRRLLDPVIDRALVAVSAELVGVSQRALDMSVEYVKERKQFGVPMLPVVAGPEKTRQHILGYTVVLVAVSLLPGLIGGAGVLYLAAALVLGAGFLRRAFALWRERSERAARRTFGFSILYLFILFGALIADKALGFAGAWW